jgi:hypothetical protein
MELTISRLLLISGPQVRSLYDPVWSKNSSSLAASKKLKFFNGDEFIEGTGRPFVPARDRNSCKLRVGFSTLRSLSWGEWRENKSFSSRKL